MAKMTPFSQRRLGPALAALLAVPTWLAPLPAVAEPGSPAAQSDVDQAQERYKRALDLFNDGSYDAALLEFRRAYELAPNYRVLYNIALVNVQLNDYAGAVNAFEKYLASGGTEVPPARVEEVKRELIRLTPRVATLKITTDVPGAEVSVDDLSIGKTPFAQPTRVNAGRRRVSVAIEGKIPQTRVVEAAGGDSVEVKFELDAPVEAAAPAPVQATPAPVEEPRHAPWFAWTLTGAFAAGTAVTGVLALKAHSDQDATKNRLGVTESDLSAANSKVSHLALVTDILLGATVVTGGISLYLTLRSPSPSNPITDQARLTILPGGVAARIPF
jgi:hypothetical protein